MESCDQHEHSDENSIEQQESADEKPIDQYEYSDEKSIDPELICIICNKPLSDPSCTPCDHIFCQQCITKWLETDDPTCATCREPVVITDLKPASRIVRNMLDHLRIICLVCGQTDLERGNFQDHIVSSCSEAQIPCSSADIQCPWTGKRNELEAHLTTCVFHPLRSIFAPIVAENKQLKEEITKYTSQNIELEAENQRQKTEIEQFTQQCSEYQIQIKELTEKVEGE
jgi:hypothetical protein